MKRKIAIMLIFAFSLALILPSTGYSWYRGHPGHYYGHAHYYGWAPAAIIAGAFITSAIVIGATQRDTRPVYQPPVVYVNPGPTVYYPPSNQPYAAPDPDFMAKYDRKEPAGEWISLPGQWVGNTWVPQHKVFVPANP
jgi:hypothetical protein